MDDTADRAVPHSDDTVGTSGAGALGDLAEPRLQPDTGLSARVARVIEPALADLALRLVRIKLTTGPDATLQIMAERADGSMSIDDCETASKALSPVLDLEDPITTPYRLELSSPGIDRPLVRVSDFRRAVGHEAKIELGTPLDGRRRFRGVLTSIEGNALTLTMPDARAGEAAAAVLPLDAIADARLVLTDALIRASLQAAEQTEAAEDQEPDRGEEVDVAAPEPAVRRGPGRFAVRNKSKPMLPAGIQTLKRR